MWPKPWSKMCPKAHFRGFIYIYYHLGLGLHGSLPLLFLSLSYAAARTPRHPLSASVSGPSSTIRPPLHVHPPSPFTQPLTPVHGGVEQSGRIWRHDSAGDERRGEVGSGSGASVDDDSVMTRRARWRGDGEERRPPAGGSASRGSEEARRRADTRVRWLWRHGRLRWAPHAHLGFLVFFGFCH